MPSTIACRTAALLLALGTFPLAVGFVQAQSYPAKPIRMIVPFPVGGGSDSTARILSQRLTEPLRQPIVIDNRVGAAGMIGTEVAARSAPDGYTLLLGSASEITMLPAIASKLPFDPLKDFVPIARVADVPLLLLVHPALPVRSPRELIELARKRPGEINFGSTGVGSMTHLAMLLFNTLSSVRMEHVAYKGVPYTDLMAGVLQAGTHTMPGSIALVKAGRLRALAITTARRSPMLPDLPTVAESGLTDYEVTLWTGVFAPTGTPREVVARIERDISATVALPDTREALTRLGSEPHFSGSEAFSAFLRIDHARWVKLGREADIRL
jgi:tripartite-type tricarboxylate transporter receptor subunit TctC